MKNKPKCPYIEKTKFCTHKCASRDELFGKKGWRRKCGYPDCRKCPMYNEWQNLNISYEISSMDELKLYQTEGRNQYD